MTMTDPSNKETVVRATLSLLTTLNVLLSELNADNGEDAYFTAMDLETEAHRLTETIGRVYP